MCSTFFLTLHVLCCEYKEQRNATAKTKKFSGFIFLTLCVFWRCRRISRIELAQLEKITRKSATRQIRIYVEKLVFFAVLLTT